MSSLDEHFCLLNIHQEQALGVEHQQDKPQYVKWGKSTKMKCTNMCVFQLIKKYAGPTVS